MIRFNPITLETKAIFDKYASIYLRNCDAAFANLFCWQQTYHSLYAKVCGSLVVKYRVEGSADTAYMLLMREFTSGNLERLIPELEADAAADGQRLCITSLPAVAAGILHSSFGKRFACAQNRDTADYIYTADDIRNLTGRRYQPKRNHLNRFNDSYNWTYEPLTAAHKDECMQLESVWQSHHSDDDTIAAERLAIIRAFDNFEALGLVGGLLRIDGRPVAFTYGSPVNCETFDIHVEKADTSFEGIFPAINRLFAQHIPEQYKYINREEDMGLDGLRRSKLSYHPAALEYKYTALALNDTEQDIRALWAEVFGDDDSFIEKFLVVRRQYGIRTLTKEGGGKVVSMLHIVPFTDAEGKLTAYIYGVATDAAHRRRGYATALLEEAMQLIRRDFDSAMLIPSGSESARLYSKFGFIQSDSLLRFETEFDFGSGNPDSDKPMIFSPEKQESASEIHLFATK